MARLTLITLALTGGFLLLLGVQALLARSGGREDFQNPSREVRAIGTGKRPLTYVVIGDSTAAGQGASTGRGIGPLTAQALAKDQSIRYANFAVSGAKASEVLGEQLPLARRLKPDLVLVSVGANDVTGLSSLDGVARDLATIADDLIEANCKVKIVLTGSPDLGGAHRLAQPLRALTGMRSRRLNAVVESMATGRKLTFAPIAVRTGPSFRRDPTLLAADKYHPNDRGYALWIDVLELALDDALRAQPSHCP